MSTPPDAYFQLFEVVSLFHNLNVETWFMQNRYAQFQQALASANPAIETEEESLMTAVTIQPSDSANMVFLRIHLFWTMMNYGANFQQPLYGIPADVWDEWTFDKRPRVNLFFEEDTPPTPTGYSKVQAEVSFRLMNLTNLTIQSSEIQTLATNIQTEFGAVPCWSFEKGATIYTYQDKANGLWLKIYALDQTNAMALIEKVLACIPSEPAFDATKFKWSSSENASTNTSATTEVLGQISRKPRYRPTANVRFRYATLVVQGVRPIVLYDPYHRLTQAPLKVYPIAPNLTSGK